MPSDGSSPDVFDPLPTSSPAHELAVECLTAGVRAAQPKRAVERHCDIEGSTLRIGDGSYDLDAYDSLRILGGGKAADGLAAALEGLLGERLDGGIVVTGHRTAAPDRVTVREGNHPSPGPDSVDGANALLEQAEAADGQTLVLAPMTGGGSALLCAPADGLSAADIRTVTEALLDAGASVDELNAVRRVCSEIKGGGLAAAAAPATVVGVVMSDVVGDDPAVVASGPTVPVEAAPDVAATVLDRYGVDAPAVRRWLSSATPESPSVAARNHVIASGWDAVDAARAHAAAAGYQTCVLSTHLEGEAEQSGRFHAAVATDVALRDVPVEPPAVILSGGETTVSVSGDGVGGPNMEFALAAAPKLPDEAVVGAVDTDGSDGSTDAAGALVDADTVGPQVARTALDENDSYRALADTGALLFSGPTGTNVNDLRVVVVD